MYYGKVSMKCVLAAFNAVYCVSVSTDRLSVVTDSALWLVRVLRGVGARDGDWTWIGTFKNSVLEFYSMRYVSVACNSLLLYQWPHTVASILVEVPVATMDCFWH